MLAPTLLLLTAASPVPTNDLWIDPVHGSDAASGTSAASPLRSVTRATALAPPGSTLHLGPGTYDAASGETFPIVLDGIEAVAVDGPNTPTFVPTRNSTGFRVSNGARLEGVALHVDGTGVSLFSDQGQPTAQVVDVTFDSAPGSTFNAGIQVNDGLIRGCEFEGLADGVIHWGEDLVLEDCRFEACLTGVSVFIWYSGQWGSLEMRRCSVTGGQDGGVYLGDGCFVTPYALRMEDCLIADCGSPAFGAGLAFNDCHGIPNFSAELAGCTIVDCTGQGIAHGGSVALTLDSCIVARSGFGDIGGAATIVRSLVGDGSGLAGPGPNHGGGNVSGDPRFVDPANGDYSLRFDSPAVDSGQHVGLDLVGRPRAVDGDLDLLPAPDMGALEHATLVGPTEIQLGAGFELAASGPAGGFTSVVMSHLGYAPTGLTTPYGRLFVEPAGSVRLTPVMTTGGGPVTFSVPAFTDPALIGTSTGFQALTRSLAAPAGGAFSNPLLVPVN